MENHFLSIVSIQSSEIFNPTVSQYCDSSLVIDPVYSAYFVREKNLILQFLELIIIWSWVSQSAVSFHFFCSNNIVAECSAICHFLEKCLRQKSGIVYRLQIWTKKVQITIISSIPEPKKLKKYILDKSLLLTAIKKNSKLPADSHTIVLRDH